MHVNRLNHLNHPPPLTRSPPHLPAGLKPPDLSSPPPLLPFAPSHLPLTAAPENNHLSTACLICSVFTHPLPSSLQSVLPGFRASPPCSCSRANPCQSTGRPPSHPIALDEPPQPTYPQLHNLTTSRSSYPQPCSASTLTLSAPNLRISAPSTPPVYSSFSFLLPYTGCVLTPPQS